MGANPTQAQGVCLFFAGFTMIAAGFMAGLSFLWIGLGILAVAASIMLFLKCKPWEHNED